MTAISGTLRSARLATGLRRLSRITVPLTAISMPLMKRGTITDQAVSFSLSGHSNDSVKVRVPVLAEEGRRYGRRTGCSVSSRTSVASVRR